MNIHQFNWMLFIYSAHLFMVFSEFHDNLPAEQTGLYASPVLQKLGVRETRVIVVNTNLAAGSDLFTVASIPPDSAERFAFSVARDDNLLMDFITGMVSRGPGHQWNNNIHKETFEVNITRLDDPEYLDTMMVDMHLVTRGDFDPILTNLPRHLWETIPTWIRPDTTVFTAASIDAEIYGAPVHYVLESVTHFDDTSDIVEDGSGTHLFYVVAETGEVKIKARQEWVENHLYELSISAQCEGAALQPATPSQVLSIQVGVRSPQFYKEDFHYIVNVPETSFTGQVGLIQAKSFQGLAVTFAATAITPTPSGIFIVNSNTGVLSLNSARSFNNHPHQYRYTLRADEEFPSPHTSTTTLVINLVAENRNDPYFGPAVYIVRDIREDVAINSLLFTVTGIDNDWGINGEMDFYVDDPHFQVTPVGTDGKEAEIRVAQLLDYDFLEDFKYEFQITAVDRGTPGRTGSVTGQVYLTNINDNPPMFLPVDEAVRLLEGASSSTLVHVVQAFDPDGDDFTFSFNVAANTASGACGGGRNSGTVCGLFTLNQNTGHITLNNNVFRGQSDLTLTVDATDQNNCCPGTGGGPLTSTGTVETNFLGVNNPPRFPECNMISASVQEGQEPGVEVIEVQAADEDSGINGEVTFSLEYRIGEFRPFAVNYSSSDPMTAVITTTTLLDRENPQGEVVVIDNQVNYMVTLTATDRGVNPLTTHCFFFVQVDDINDNNPVFDNDNNPIQGYFLRTATDPRVLRVYATDEDYGQNAQVEYSIQQDPACPNCFDIDSMTGWISRTSGPIGGGITVVNMVVSVSDNGNPPLSNVAPTSVAIHIRDTAAQMPPDWDNHGVTPIDDATITIAENVAPGAIVGTFLATVQADETITYNLITRPGMPSPFRIETIGGDAGINLVVVGFPPLVYTEQSELVVKMRASVRLGAGNEPNRDVRLTVSLTDMNVNVPDFVGTDLEGAYPAAVSPETARDQEVVSVRAHDRDGTSPNNLVTYSFAEGCTDCGFFTLESTTGIIRSAHSFTGAEGARLILDVVAQDGAESDIGGVTGPNTARGTVVVSVIAPSDNPAEFLTDLVTVNVEEGAVFQTNITIITAINPEEMNLPQYSIVAGNDERFFAAELLTGRIFVTGNVRDPGQAINMIYRVFDGNQERFMNLTINVDRRNLFDPVFSPTVYTSDRVITEGDAGPHVITTVTATDTEFNAAVTYSLAGPSFTNNPGAFSVNPNTGEVTLQTAISRDFPLGHDPWQISVVAQDNPPFPLLTRRGYALINILLIDINDNAPVFDIQATVGSVDEQSGTGALVLQLNAVDFDMGNNAQISYSAVTQIPQLGEQDLFSVAANGAITTTIAASQIMWPEHEMFSFTVQAADNPVTGEPLTTDQLVEIFVADIRDHDPSFVGAAPLQISMPEMIPVGGSVTVLTATDADFMENAQRVYVVAGGSDAPSYYMDSIYQGGTGVLRIQDIVDYDDMVNPNMSVSVTVQNPTGPPQGPLQIQITVTDINDNAPVFNPDVIETTIQEPGAIGSPVATVIATDRDSGVNAEFEYSIDYENTDPTHRFQVDPISGEVTLRNELDRETIELHIVHVLSTDKGEPSQTGTATLNVTVGDANDNAPNFVPPAPNPTVSATATQGSEVVRFSVYDPDTEENGTPFTLEYVCNDPACNDFSLRSEDQGRTGVIVAERTGYERPILGFSHYDLEIRMSDNPTSGEQSMSAVRPMRVYVESGNSFPPEDGKKTIRVYNFRRLFDHLNLGRVFVAGEDDWDSTRNYKTFTFRNAAEEPDFSVAPNDGTIVMRKTAGRGTHVLEVGVEDSFWGTATTSIVEVIVTHIEETTIHRSGSVRIKDTTPEELLDQQPGFLKPLEPSALERFRTVLAEKLGHGITEENILIYGVVEVEERVVDVTFSVRTDSGDYLRSSYLDGVLITYRQDFEAALGRSISLAPVNLCQPGYAVCWDSGCTTHKRTTNSPVLIDMNSISIVGIDITYEWECVCQSRTFEEGSIGERCSELSCLNGGICVDETWGNSFRCICPEEFDGDRCQQTKITFLGNGWAYFEQIEQCEDGKFSFEFATTQPSALLLYSGPILNPTAGELSDFLSIELNNGRPRVRIDMGSGEISLTVTTPQVLNDGNWHTVEIFKERKEFRLVVDHCSNAQVDETIEISNVDRSMCEAIAQASGESFLIKTVAPLQLGGRSVDGPFPGNLNGGFSGCIKNLWNNGKLYDLRTEFGGSDGTKDGCSLEDCSLCSLNTSTCVGDINQGTPRCYCKPGFGGPDCDQDVAVKNFGSSPSYIEWMFRPTFFNASVNPFYATFQISFRTRQENGIIFSASSFSAYEQFILEVNENCLLFTYDVGSGNRYLSLDYIDVNDGEWHNVQIGRYGNQAILRLDNGEGRFYNETFIDDAGHVLLILGQRAHGSAYVTYQIYTNRVRTSNDLIESCLMDPRYGDVWIPMDPAEQYDLPQSLAIVSNSSSMNNGCESSMICGPAVCPFGQYCVDSWNDHVCRCENMMEIPNPQAPITCIGVYDCSIDPCINGDCLPLEDEQNVICDCDTGYESEFCNSTIVTVSVVTGMGTGLIVGLSLFILTILGVMILVGFVYWKRMMKSSKTDNMHTHADDGASERSPVANQSVPSVSAANPVYLVLHSNEDPDAMLETPYSSLDDYQLSETARHESDYTYIDEHQMEQRNNTADPTYTGLQRGLGDGTNETPLYTTLRNGSFD